MAVFTNEQIEQLKQGWGVVRTQEQIETDLERDFQERMKREREQEEAERIYRERMEQERKERQEMNYMIHKEIFDFMKVFNELEPDDFYCVIELNNGEQFMAKPKELKRDAEYIFFYIMKQKRGQLSWGENPLYCELEINVNEVKGIKLVEEEQREITIIKKSVYGKMVD